MLDTLAVCFRNDLPGDHKEHGSGRKGQPPRQQCVAEADGGRADNAETMIFGGVPIRVTSPPRMDPKDSGIRTRAGDREALAADSRAAGINMASAPTLFMTIDSDPATPAKGRQCVLRST